jgi:TatD DNase family protein
VVLVDSHAHVDSEDFDADREAVWQRARAAGVQRIVPIGVHPHDAAQVPAEDWATLERLAAQPSVCAIGETGLDYHYMHSPVEAQRAGFERQLQLAAALKKPVTIHLRDADEDALVILETSGIARGPGAVVHCFTGGPAIAERYLALGLLLSFSGIVTFNNATALQEAARLTPLDRLLIETDSPFLAPIPHRGKRNEPAFVGLVATRIAELKGISAEEVGAAALRNTERLFAAH